MAIFKQLSSSRSSSSLAGSSRSSSSTDIAPSSKSSRPITKVASKLFGQRNRAYERFDATKPAKLQRSKPDLYILAVQELGEDFMEELPLRQPLLGQGRKYGKTTEERLYESRSSGKYGLLREIAYFHLEVLLGIDTDNIGRSSRVPAH